MYLRTLPPKVLLYRSPPSCSKDLRLVSIPLSKVILGAFLLEQWHDRKELGVEEFSAKVDQLLA